MSRFGILLMRLLAPLPRPNSLRDHVGFEEHFQNSMKTFGSTDPIPEEWFKLPIHYKGQVDRIFGPEDTVPYPTITEKFDYELEIRP